MPNLRETLEPTIVLGAVADMEAWDLIDHLPPGIQAVSRDVDRTLLGHHEAQIPKEHVELMRGLADLNVGQVFLSNAGSQPRTDRVKRLAAGVESLIGHEIHVATSRMVDGKKKPARPLFDYGAHLLDLANVHICHVGDQLFKDVLGANRAGYGATVLVAPYGSGDDPRVRYLQRPLEAAIRPWVGVPILARNFGKQ